MKRVKEMREEKIKRKEITELMRHRQEIINELQEIEREESKHVDWRSDLEEGMTTASIVQETLPAVGPVDLATAYPNFTLSGPGNAGDYNSVTHNVQGNSSKYDTLYLRVTTSSSDWAVASGYGSLVIYGQGGPGNFTFTAPVQRGLYYSSKDDGSFSASTTYQRRNDVKAVVSLDDPDASAFVRGGLGGSEERKAKLKDMLDASNELMVKMGLDPSQTSPGDIKLAGSLSGPRNSPGEGAVPAYPSPRGPFTPLKNYGTDKNPKLMPSGPVVNPYRLA